MKNPALKFSQQKKKLCPVFMEDNYITHAFDIGP